MRIRTRLTLAIVAVLLLTIGSLGYVLVRDTRAALVQDVDDRAGLALGAQRVQRGSGRELQRARQQAQLNRLVIEEMADGVMVVDQRARVRAANPAARRLLVAQGIGQPAPFQPGTLPPFPAQDLGVA